MVSMVDMSFALCGLCIFACVRTMAWDIDAALYIKRVPTKDNLADDPSRERYDLLERMEVRPPFFTFLRLPLMVRHLLHRQRRSKPLSTSVSTMHRRGVHSMPRPTDNGGQK